MANATAPATAATTFPWQPPQPLIQIGATETWSENILGPVAFYLHDLEITASTANPSLPKQVAPKNSPYIIATNEPFSLSVKVTFNNTPLTKLLLCLGTKIQVDFCAEGCGAKASETDLIATITTQKDVFDYTLTYSGTPDGAGLTEGFYEIAAVAKIVGATNPCAADVMFGAGYLAAVFLQVYPAF